MLEYALSTCPLVKLCRVGQRVVDTTIGSGFDFYFNKAPPL